MPNKIFTNTLTPIIFLPSGSALPTGVGMPSGVAVMFGVDNLAYFFARVSNQYDLGPAPRATLFEWRGKAVPPNGASVGFTVDMFISTSNSVAQDGALPTIDTTINNLDKPRNLQYLGSLQVDNTNTPPDPAESSGLIEIYGRYISLVWWNNMGNNLGTGNYLILTPAPDEIESY